MKKKKIKIKELQISSFVTDIQGNTAHTVRGGTDFVRCQTPHLESNQFGICEGSCPSYLYVTQEVNEHGIAVVCV